MPSNNVTRDGVPHDRYLVFEGLRFQSSKKAFIIISQSLTDMVQFVIRHTQKLRYTIRRTHLRKFDLEHHICQRSKSFRIILKQ